MTDLPELLAECEARGIRLLPVDDRRLTIDAPKGALTAALVERLRSRKGELLALLRSPPVPLKDTTDAAAVWQTAFDRLAGHLEPELRPHLEAAWEEAEPGTEYAITRYRDTNANLRTQLTRIIRRAGPEPWPKLFQNLRSTRETELAESFPMHAVCKWIGNSEPVAAKHYLQVTDEHYEKAAQNPAQYASKLDRTDRETEGETSKIPEEYVSLVYCTNVKVAEAGFEPARGVTLTGF